MENSFYVKSFRLLLFFWGVVFATPFSVYAYSDKTTHPALTQEIVKYFNTFYPARALSGELGELVIYGSIAEDENTRWMKHFYDPIYDRGLTIGQESWPNAKEWGTNTDLQATFIQGSLVPYFTAPLDYSWDRAIYEYAWGDRKRGLRSLGQVLHLIEDMAVPDHTRNDPHPPVLDLGSPYEAWTAQFDRLNIEIPMVLPSGPAEFLSIKEYFENMSLFSNKNFFSKDTIEESIYENKIFGNIGGFDFGIIEGDRYFLRRKIIKLQGQVEYTLVDPDKLILSDYWRILSREAVRNGVGVMKLFFDEVAKEQKTKVLYEKNRPWLSRFMGKVYRDMNLFIFGSTKKSSNASVVSAFSSSVASEPEVHRVEIVYTPKETSPPKKEEVVVGLAEFPAVDLVAAEEIIVADVPPVVSEAFPEVIVPDISPGFGGGAPVFLQASITAEVPVEEDSEDDFPDQEVEMAGGTEDVVPGSIVFNEVAWMGTHADPRDEWVELASTHNSRINLENFFVRRAGSEDPLFWLSGSIDPGAFYLIESDENAVGGIPADLIVAFPDSLSNGGESLVLGHSSDGISTTTIDTLFLCESWCNKGSLQTFASMEKRQPEFDSANPDRWGTNNTIITRGVDRNATRLFATPRFRNSLSHLINDGMPIDQGTTTLSIDKSPYLVTSFGLQIPVGTALSIDPGVVIKFHGTNLTSLTVFGDLYANGTSDQPIVFTHFTDDAHGGDLNGDGAQSLPQSGFWAGVLIQGALAHADLRNSIIRYGGGNFSAPANLYAVEASVALDSVVSEYANRYGMYFDRSDSTILRSISRFNQNSSTGIVLSSSNARVEDSVSEGNIDGLSASGASPIIRNNIFRNNAGRAMQISSLVGGAEIAGNSGEGNGNNSISLIDRFLSSGTTTLHMNPLPYSFTTSNAVIPAGAAALFGEGARILFANGRVMSVDGRLEVAGTGENPVIFTPNTEAQNPTYIDSNSAIDVQLGGSLVMRNAEIRLKQTGIRYADSTVVSLDSVLFRNLMTGIRMDGSVAVDFVHNLTFETVGVTTSPAGIF